jgi:hypothetical protein
VFARPVIPPGLSAKERFPSFYPNGKTPISAILFSDTLRTDIAYQDMNKQIQGELHHVECQRT